MRRFFYLLACLALFPAAFSAGAQTVQDGSYRTIGYIKSDGSMQDGSYRSIGCFRSDGTVQDGSYRTIGHIRSDGTVQDGSYRIIGYAKGIPTRWTAFFFFFR